MLRKRNLALLANDWGRNACVPPTRNSEFPSARLSSEERSTKDRPADKTFLSLHFPDERHFNVTGRWFAIRKGYVALKDCSPFSVLWIALSRVIHEILSGNYNQRFNTIPKFPKSLDCCEIIILDEWKSFENNRPKIAFCLNWNCNTNEQLRYLRMELFVTTHNRHCYTDTPALTSKLRSVDGAIRDE